MLLFYQETRNKIKNKVSSKNNYNKQSTKPNAIRNSKIDNNKKKIISNSKDINIKKSNSFFILKKIEELKDISNFINIQRNKINENSKTNQIQKIKKKQYSCTFQNFYNNYPKPEPFPKKIDIRIINHNNNINNIKNIDSNSIHNARNNNEIYDDKKILFILTNLGLENIYSNFKDNFIVYDDLKFLTKDDFIEMKIPIGPRNRIMHFIEELNKIENQLDFNELKSFIDEYKKAYSGNFLKNQKKPNSNILFFNSLNENNKSEKKFNNSDIINIKNNKFYSENLLFNSKYSESNENINKYKSNYSIDSKETNEYNRKNSNDQINKFKNNYNNSYIIDNDFFKSNFTYNEESLKFHTSIFEKINKAKTPNNKLNTFFKQPNKLIRNNSYNKYNYSEKTKNKNYKKNNFNLSKTLINKLDIINKEVEKYELNYKKLKNETKRRNRNVQRILSNNIFYSKSSNFLKYKGNNNKDSSKEDSYIIYNTNNNQDLEDEKERNIIIELNK